MIPSPFINYSTLRSSGIGTPANTSWMYGGTQGIGNITDDPTGFRQRSQYSQDLRRGVSPRLTSEQAARISARDGISLGAGDRTVGIGAQYSPFIRMQQNLADRGIQAPSGIGDLSRTNYRQGGFSGISSDPSQALQQISQSGRFWGNIGDQGFNNLTGLNADRAATQGRAFQTGGYQNSGTGAQINAHYNPASIKQYQQTWQRQAPSMISQAYQRFMTR